MTGQLFAKFALTMADNPKIIGLSDAAFRAFVESILYSRQHLTDGFLDGRVVRRRWGQEVIDELLTNDETNPSWITVDGGFQIHQFCEYQPSNSAITEMKERKRRAGLASAAKRAEQQHNDDMQPVEQPVDIVLNIESTDAQPDTDTDTDTDKEHIYADSKPAKTKRKTKLNPHWQPDDDLRAWSKQIAPALDIDYEATKFVDWYQQTGKEYGDWAATWRNWVRRAIEMNPQLKTPLPPPKKQFGVEYV